jgi:hypothetical protein
MGAEGIGVLEVMIWSLKSVSWGKGPHPPMFKLRILPAAPYHAKTPPIPAAIKLHFSSIPA